MMTTQEEKTPDKCFACGRPLRGMSAVVATRDGQNPYVGSECYRKIKKAGPKGWQPPRGGPRLFDDYKQ